MGKPERKRQGPIGILTPIVIREAKVAISVAILILGCIAVLGVGVLVSLMLGA